MQGPIANKTPDGVESFIETEGGTFYMGDIFKAKTVKGNMNYIVFFFKKDDQIYYCHGDRAKKAKCEEFQRGISYGDIQYVPREEVDVERWSLSVIALKAMANGMTFNDYLDVLHGIGSGSRA